MLRFSASSLGCSRCTIACGASRMAIGTSLLWCPARPPLGDIADTGVVRTTQCRAVPFGFRFTARSLKVDDAVLQPMCVATHGGVKRAPRPRPKVARGGDTQATSGVEALREPLTVDAAPQQPPTTTQYLLD